MSHARVAAIATITLALAAPLLAQEDEEATFRAELAVVLDRWNDAAPEDRLARAIELCEKHLKVDASDNATRLELARFRIAHGDPDQAQADALRVAADEMPERAAAAKAIQLVAFQASTNQRLPGAKPEDRERAQKDFQAKFLELWKKLEEAAAKLPKEPGRPAVTATSLVQDEQERLATARTINLLGRPAPTERPDDDGKVRKRDPIDAKDTTGALLLLSDWKGKPVMVDFWSAGSRAYVDEVPSAVAVYERWHPKGFEAVGVCVDKDRAPLDALVKEKNVPWPQVFSARGLADEVARGWGVDQVPRRFLLDHEHKVRFVDARGDGLEAAVRQLVERAEKDSKKKGD